VAEGQKRNNRLIPQAAAALDQFKYEVATELGINPEYKTGYWGNISARECGAVGGHMVRRMIAAAEQSLVDQAAGNVRAGFQQAFSQPLSNVTAPAQQQGANLNQ